MKFRVRQHHSKVCIEFADSVGYDYTQLKGHASCTDSVGKRGQSK